MTLPWVGSRELAFSKTPENLIRLARQVFSLMALSWVGSHVLAPGNQSAAAMGRRESSKAVELRVTALRVQAHCLP